MSNADPQFMTCMEVWGGNALVDNSVSMSGLDAWVYSKPYEGATGGGDVYYVSFVRDRPDHAAAGGGCFRARVGRRFHCGRVADAHAEICQSPRSAAVCSLDESAIRHAQRCRCFRDGGGDDFFRPDQLPHTLQRRPSHAAALSRERRTWSLLEFTESERDDIANIPLGIDNITDYEQVGVELDVNDLVLCYSDSLIESYGTDGEMLGEKGLLEVRGRLKWLIQRKCPRIC